VSVLGLALHAHVGFAQAPASQMASDTVDMSNPDVAAIVQVARDFEKAFAAGDAKTIATMYDPGVVYMANGAPDTFGVPVIARAREAFFAQYDARVAVHIQDVRVMGDMGYDRGTFTMTMTPKAGGKAMTHTGRVFEIVKKQAGKWRSYRVMLNDPGQSP
jgi:uncharacterized protein (TIGR02246 family)